MATTEELHDIVHRMILKLPLDNMSSIAFLVHLVALEQRLLSRIAEGKYFFYSIIFNNLIV